MYLILCFIILISGAIFGQINEKKYGPYKIEFLKFETCKGPKRGECGTVHIDNLRNMSDITFIIDFPKDCHVKNAKFIIGTLQNSNTTKKLWNYQPSKPCQHFVLGPLLWKSFNMTNNCSIRKGHYEVHINMNDVSRKFLGSSFFYDSFLFKTTAHNNVNNVFCVLSAIKVYKP